MDTQETIRVLGIVFDGILWVEGYWRWIHGTLSPVFIITTFNYIFTFFFTWAFHYRRDMSRREGCMLAIGEMFPSCLNYLLYLYIYFILST